MGVSMRCTEPPFALGDLPWSFWFSHVRSWRSVSLIVRPLRIMTATAQQELDLRWFFPLFIGGWLAISCFLSLIGGWHALAKRYRSTISSSGKLFSFASMRSEEHTS